MMTTNRDVREQVMDTLQALIGVSDEEERITIVEARIALLLSAGWHATELTIVREAIYLVFNPFPARWTGEGDEPTVEFGGLK